MKNYEEVLRDNTNLGIANHPAAAADPLRPIYHPIAPSGWMNDPNGFSYIDGEYHLYYQYNPQAPVWNKICWGHLVSPDLIHWQHRPIAIYPSERYDQDGVYTGAVIQFKGKTLMYYTGQNFLSGEATFTNEDMRQVQCLAIGTPDHFEKYEANPMISAPDGLIEAQFRDPYVWEDDGKMFMLLGSSDGINSRIAQYRSDDGMHWSFDAMLLEGRHGKYGYMWECPALFQLDGKKILFGNPMKMKNCLAGAACYLSGHLSDDHKRFIPEEELKAIDYGNAFYAPQTLLHSDGRRIVIGWVITPSDQLLGWTGANSIPRVAHQADGNLWFEPLQELKMLRDESTHLGISDTAANCTLFGQNGLNKEADILLNVKGPGEVYLQYGENSDVFFRFELIDTSMAVLETVHGRQALHLHNKQLRIRLFMDGCVVEAFINDGEYCLTHCVRVPGDTMIRFMTDGAAGIEQADCWRMQSIGI